MVSQKAKHRASVGFRQALPGLRPRKQSRVSTQTQILIALFLVQTSRMSVKQAFISQLVRPHSGVGLSTRNEVLTPPTNTGELAEAVRSQSSQTPAHSWRDSKYTKCHYFVKNGKTIDTQSRLEVP